MSRPALLDLFCGAGGAAMGYHRAGFDLTGVDHRPQPRYPFRFVRADALEYLAAHGREYDAIHASPPCQAYSRLRHLPWLSGRTYPALIGATRATLLAAGRPWVLENVEGAPLQGITLCGGMFGLRVYRHRRFESSWLLFGLRHPRHRAVIGRGGRLNARRPAAGAPWVTVAGHQFAAGPAGAAMGIDWMRRDELSQAIPPAYTEFLGRQLRALLAG